MHTLLTEFFELKCDERGCQDLLTESEKKMNADGFLVFPAKLQEADVKNGNGRSYPRKVLEREIENYKHLVEQRRALGECVDDQTQIFTTSGWKLIKDVELGESVFTLDIESGELKESQIEAIVDKEYSGKMIHIKSQSGLDMKMTPNHKMLLFDRNNKPYYSFASDLIDRHTNGEHISKESISKSAKFWSGNTPKDFLFPGTDKKINPLDWMAFLGIWLAEGYASGVKGGKLTNKVGIVQKKEPYKTEIRNLLNRMGVEYSEYVREGETSDFNILGNKELHSLLYSIGNSHNKYIPTEFKSWGSEALKVMLDWMLKGDGRNRIVRGKLLREYATTSTKLSQDVEELMLKTGLGSSLSVRQPYDRKIQGRMILKENQMPLYTVHESTASKKYLDTRFVDIAEVDYDGRVYCIKTDNGNFLARRNGQSFWTGNCDHPDDSVINLKNASHMVNRIWWDGNNVLGTIKVLKTPSGEILRGLYESGVLFGFSSRAMGSLQEARDSEGNSIQVVQDDLQLICFDAVSEPSAPGAYLMREGIKKKQKVLFDKSYRVNRLINDILKGD